MKTFLKSVSSGSNRAKMLPSSLVVLLFTLFALVPAHAQNTYTWGSATVGGTWTSAGSWTVSPGPGTFPGASATDSAVLGNVTSGSRIATLSLSETIGALSFAQTTAGAVNELRVGGAGTTKLTVNSALNLGGAGTIGTELLYLDGIDTGFNTHVPAYIGAVNVGTGGVLELGADAGSSGVNVTGNVEIMSGGILNVDQAVTGGSGNISTVSTINGNLTVDLGGTINLSSANSGLVSPITGAGIYDTRFAVTGNLTLNTGAKVTVNHATGTTTNNEFYFTGTSAQTATFGSGLGLTSMNGLFYVGSANSGTVFTVASDSALPTVTFKPGATTANTLNMNIGALTAGGTLSVAGISFTVPTNTSGHNGTGEVTLSSNVTLTGGTNFNPATGQTGGTIILNTNGFVFDTTTHGNFFTSNNISNWTLEGGGIIKDDVFTLGSPTGTIAAASGAVNVVGATTLWATGTSGTSTTSNLSNSLNGVLGTGTIDAVSTFEYTGSATTNESFLTSSRAIGRLLVGTGTGVPILGLSSVVAPSITGTLNTLGVGGDVTVAAGATLDLDAQNLTESHGVGATAGGLNGSGTVSNGTTTTFGTTAGTTSTLTLDTTAGNGSFSGVIADHSTGTGIVALTKVGTGTQTLSGTNTYTGATNINGGSIILASTGNIASSATSINSGGTLSGSGLAGAVTLNSGGFIAPATSGGDTTSILKASSLTWNGGGSLAFNLSTTDDTSNELTLTAALNKGTGTTFDLDLSGGLNTAGTDYTLVTFGSNNGFSLTDFGVIDSGLTSGLTGELVLNGNSLEFDIVAVPEPGTWVMMLGGLALLVVWQRRRRASQE